MKHSLLLLFLSVSLLSCSQKEEAPRLLISDEVLNAVNSHLFGHFMEKCSWGGEIGGDLVINPLTGSFDPMVLEKLKAMNIPNLRYPGGTDVDYYSWTDLIDHAPGQSSRPPYRVYQEGPGGDSVSDNRLGINEFLNLCELLEAEPILVLNLGFAFHEKQSIEEAKASAAALYTYCNMEADAGYQWADYRKKNGRVEPYAVRYFEIGNEYWGFDGLNWKHDYDTTILIPHLFNCIEAIADTLIALNSETRIIVDGPLRELNRLLEARMKDKISYLVFHTYVPWGINQVSAIDKDSIDLKTISPEQVWNAWVATPLIDISSGESILPWDRYHGSALSTGFKIAATEWNWNGWFEGKAREAGLPESDLARGVGAAGFLHAMMRKGDRVEMACQSMTVGQSWGISGIRVDPEYKQDPVYLPSLQVTGLYSNFHGNSLLRTEATKIPTYEQTLRMKGISPAEKVKFLDMLATKSGRQLFVHVINRNYREAYDLNIDLDGIAVADSFQRHSLSGDREARISNAALLQAAEITCTEFTRENRELMVKVPPASVSVFVFELN